MAPEIVLEVGFEGGAMTVYRHVTASGTTFSTSLNQVALVDMLGEDGDGIPPISRSGYVSTLAEALRHLDEKARWVLLYPLAIHGEYRVELLAAIEDRLSRLEPSPAVRDRALDRWRRLGAS